jgi:hypothetical protein
MLRATTTPLRCPRCGAERVAPTRYGLPSPEMVAASAAGHILVGGCMIWPAYPHWRCLDCGHEGQSGEA